MIRSISFDPKDAAKVVPWWDACPAWKGRTEFTFEPGLTVVCGPNGTGKTALFTLLSRLLFAEQGGRSTLTWQSVYDAAGYPFAKISLDHDGQGIWHFDSAHQVGLVGGMAAFDEDFFEEGIKGVLLNRASAGQGTLHRLAPTIMAAKSAKAPGIGIKKGTRPTPAIQAFLAGRGEPGQPTFLLDEPDRNLDADNQVALWVGLNRLAERCQIIVASHSNLPMLQKCPPRFLETVPGYVEKTNDRLLAFLDA